MGDKIKELKDELALSKGTQSCGHPNACIYNGDEGTNHCKMCVLEAELTALKESQLQARTEIATGLLRQKDLSKRHAAFKELVGGVAEDFKSVCKLIPLHPFGNVTVKLYELTTRLEKGIK